MGIDVRWVTDEKPESYEKLIDDKTRAIYLETIGNPGFNVPDFEKIVAVAHKHGVCVSAQG